MPVQALWQVGWLEFVQSLGLSDFSALFPEIEPNVQLVVNVGDWRRRFGMISTDTNPPGAPGSAPDTPHRVFFGEQLDPHVGNVTALEIAAGDRGCWISHLSNLQASANIRVYLVATGFFALTGPLAVVPITWFGDTLPADGALNFFPHGTAIRHGALAGPPSGGGVVMYSGTGQPTMLFTGDGGELFLPRGRSCFLIGSIANTAITPGGVVEEPL